MPDQPPHATPSAAKAASDETRLLRARVLEAMAGSAWHELAQPLGGLRSFVTMLRLDGVTADQLGVDPSLIEQAAASAERLARALTDLARGTSREAGIRDIVDDQLALAGGLLADVDVSLDVPHDAPEPTVDPAVLRLAVAALLLDAVTALGGQRHARGTLVWTLHAGTETLDLVLDHDGATAEPASLSTVRSLLAPHGAAVRHAPAGHRGNRVTLTLPIAQATEHVPVTPKRESPTPTPADGPIVLVCDDDAVVRGLIVRSLTRTGLRAIATGTAEDALAVVGREPVDVVLADDRMAGMGGRELHAAVAATNPDLGARFVLMSGDAGDTDLVAYAEAEHLHVLAKPFDLAALPAILREVADG